jgi:glutathione S-transferase
LERVKAMLKIWGRFTSVNVQKVMWTVGEIGVPYERIDLGGQFGGLDTPAYLAMNPNGRVPTIDDGGVIVWESNAIVRYLVARYSAGYLWDRSPGSRAGADQWMDWMQTTLAPDFYRLFWAVVRTPPDRRNQPNIAKLTRHLVSRYELLDRQLASHPYLVGSRLSMGDLAIGVTLYRYYGMEIDRPALPHLRAWYERLSQRTPYQSHVMTSFEELRNTNIN